ncbi:hypothetical protein OSH10_22045 [Kaistia defluvii]|nr:hypothetical protein [Kaistia defluvii]
MNPLAKIQNTKAIERSSLPDTRSTARKVTAYLSRIEGHGGCDNAQVFIENWCISLGQVKNWSGWMGEESRAGYWISYAP